MDYRWLQGVYDDYRRGDPETMAGVRALQRKVAIGCASPRDVSVLKGLDAVHGMVVGQDKPADAEASVFISDTTLRALLDLVAQARRPASVNLLTAGTSPMRRHGGTAISGYYDNGPFFGAPAHGGGGGARGGGGFSRGGAAARAPSAPTTSSPSRAMSFHPGGGHGHGVRHRPGGGFASWIGPWGIWPDDCYLDVYGRIWCWGPYGWQVVA